MAVGAGEQAVPVMGAKQRPGGDRLHRHPFGRNGFGSAPALQEPAHLFLAR